MLKSVKIYHTGSLGFEANVTTENRSYHREAAKLYIHTILGLFVVKIHFKMTYGSHGWILQSWSYVVQQMLTPEGDHSDPPLFKKMFLIPESNPTKNTRRKILNLLSEFDLDKVVRTCPAAGKFYAWVSWFLCQPDHGCLSRILFTLTIRMSFRPCLTI